VSQKLALIGFPYDKNSSFLEGAAEAPPLIRKALYSDSSNLWTESCANLEGVFHDAGDVTITSEKEFIGIIESSITDLLEKEYYPISLGGDHSITYPIVNALHKKYSDLSILHFDAHPDIYHDFQGNRYSHASPFARIMENHLARRLVQVGIRTMNGHQREQTLKFGVEVYEMKDWQDNTILEFRSPLYISVDMDALDPAFAPGVSHQEGGGLTTRQLVSVIQRLKAPVIIGADIVEFNPRRDPAGITAMAAAKILKEISARML
jgi:agmatinase